MSPNRVELILEVPDPQGGGQLAQVFALDVRPVTVGRAPSNELVITDEHVSWHHALFWTEAGGVWVRDLQSRNGVFVDEERIEEARRLVDGARVRLGPNVTMRAVLADGPADLPRPEALAVEDLASGMRFAISGDRFVIGSDDAADLRLDGDPAETATLIVHPNGEVWLGQDEQDHPLDQNEVFEVGGREFRLCKVEAVRAPTSSASAGRYPYRVEARLDGATGPEATVRHLVSSLEHRISADNRAVLLYLLARKAAEDLDAGVPAGERGWCMDSDIAGGIWGKRQHAGDPNRLHVLIYRLRRELKDAGFDPWFIEKRRRYVRARLSEAVID